MTKLRSTIPYLVKGTQGYRGTWQKGTGVLQGYQKCNPYPTPRVPLPQPLGGTLYPCCSLLTALQSEFEALKQSLVSSSEEASSSSNQSPCTAPTAVPPHPPTPSTSTSSMSVVQEGIAHPQHQWLQLVLDHPHCPPFIHHIDSATVPLTSYAMPDDVPQALEVHWHSGAPRYLGFDSNGDLCSSSTCHGSKITKLILLPQTSPLPHQ